LYTIRQSYEGEECSRQREPWSLEFPASKPSRTGYFTVQNEDDFMNSLLNRMVRCKGPGSGSSDYLGDPPPDPSFLASLGALSLIELDQCPVGDLLPVGQVLLMSHRLENPRFDIPAMHWT
jgi:hypothetical protein